jgi:hypothetical protein
VRELLLNNTFDELDGGIDSSQTTITVLNGGAFPATGDFRLAVNGEIMLCTGRTGDDLTVVRGVEGSTPASHTSGDPVVHVLTAGGADRWGKDNVGLWGSTAPPLNKLLADDGSILAASDFTWINQGAATATDQNGTILLTVPPVTGENVRGLFRSAPTAPYVYVGAFRHVGFRRQDGSSVPNFGMGFRESATGKLQTLSILVDGTTGSRMSLISWPGPTSTGTESVTRSNFGLIGPDVWFRIENDATNLKFSVGDGLAYTQIYSTGVGTHFTTSPDQVGWYANHFASASAWDYLVRLCHWSRES